jgi:hypothetical protein
VLLDYGESNGGVIYESNMGEKREGDGVSNGVKKGMKTLFSPSFL